MRKVDIGRFGVVVDPAHVKTLVTEELLNDEITNVTLQTVDTAKRVSESQIIVNPDEYIHYLELCKESLKQPTHPEHVYTPEEDISKVLRYERVVRGLMDRISKLEESVRFYNGPLGDSVENIIVNTFDGFDIDVVKDALVYRGLLGDTRARELFNANHHESYDEILELMENN